MGFNKVYKSLQEVFPQIDARVLRAVAIEHSKDVDAAVEAVLLEIIPYFTERSGPSGPLSGSIAVRGSSEAFLDAVAATSTADDGLSTNRVSSAEVQNGYNVNGRNQQSIHVADDDDEHKNPFYNTYDGHHEGQGDSAESELSGKILETNIQTDGDVYSHGEAVALVDKDGKAIRRILVQMATIMCVGTPSLNTHDLTRSPLDQLVVLPDAHASNLEEPDASLSDNTACKMEPNSNIIGTEDEAILNASVSQSSQIHNIDVLEEIIADARNNKKTLFSAMQSVIKLMREVELREEAAEQAKVEAAAGGADILAEVEDLKQMVQTMKEANGMVHAGEVYGEKAILATELRELQSRVLCLTDERDKSLAVLLEMNQTLEARLAAAESEIKSMEQEKIEKDKAAMKALAEQELIMEKVMQESEILKQQTEDNARLQEFLLDRGRVVDMLQGEIAVICQDVRLLKEKFDARVPFSKSLSSSQTSCILASSSSSLKTLIPEQVESLPDEAADSMGAWKKRDKISCSDENSYEEKAAKDDLKALQDDGWELFDSHETYA
ncbi:hypothetical protein Sango_0386000 [Sesamum angolense]|uniref:CUE domain-containing protein n=1 Tax=Sesamum angolense TaxID=2727404 RepID=A0AAE2C468_9LAMI|nr:hypothetical protein Sango_0386000 [Sesamum angolense]